MLLTFIICFLLIAGYTTLMVLYRKGWEQQKEFTVSARYLPQTRISVVIPARNEAHNIGQCIDSILAQIYPDYLFEIIVVDDHSEDGTARIVEEYANSNVRCISLSSFIPMGGKINAYKKQAIAAGISQSRGELIVTTDADCMAPNAWLLHIAAMYEQQDPVMIVAPVIYTSNHGIIQVFQLIDFMSMQGITAAAHSMQMGNMSNGANLAFRKATFDHIGGYDGIEHMASGDDYLLMMKMNKFSPGRIAYLKSEKATVSTAPQPDWKSFLQQRIRWSSKTGKYNDAKLTGILLFVYLFNLSFLVLAIGGIFSPALLFLGLGMLMIKMTAEYYFLIPVARFFRREWALKFFPFLQPIHILYIIVAGFFGLLGGYEWKGRKVR
jgi:cellulose synthase/poly-beta-1,6-N-acetylglucosamine synthase-like glycosyltransferase